MRLSCCFESIWACLITPNLLLWIPNHIEISNFITQLNLGIKPTYYLSSLGHAQVSNHTHLKSQTTLLLWMTIQFQKFIFIDIVVRDNAVSKILHSDWSRGFWIITQEPNFSQTSCLFKTPKISFLVIFGAFWALLTHLIFFSTMGFVTFCNLWLTSWKIWKIWCTNFKIWHCKQTDRWTESNT